MVYATIRFMRFPLRAASIIACIASITVLALAGPLGVTIQAQQESTVAVWLELVNEVRLDEGLNPYGQSRLLTNAAQRHADDLAQNGPADPDDMHRGSDGSDEQERIEEAGYAAWTLDDDQVVVAENVWSGQGTPQDALAFFLEDQPDRDNVLSDAYREIGIGVATDADGGSVYVLDFGARPNVLPIFVNDGAATTENREVAVRLTNERVRPEGQGAGFIGEAIEIRVSDEPTFEDLTWRPWAPLVSWTLPDVAGEHTVYVQFRDAAGRTAASADGIVLDRGTPATPTTVPSTSTPTPRPTDTGVPASPTPQPTDTQEPATPTDQPTVTATPSPAASPPEPSPSPSSSASPVLRATPFPTWTPLPSPDPTPVDLEEMGEKTLSLPNMSGYRRSLAAVGVLQGVVIVLGVYWFLRRGRGA